MDDSVLLNTEEQNIRVKILSPLDLDPEKKFQVGRAYDMRIYAAPKDKGDENNRTIHIFPYPIEYDYNSSTDVDKFNQTFQVIKNAGGGQKVTKISQKVYSYKETQKFSFSSKTPLIYVSENTKTYILLIRRSLSLHLILSIYQLNVSNYLVSLAKHYITLFKSGLHLLFVRRARFHFPILDCRYSLDCESRFCFCSLGALISRVFHLHKTPVPVLEYTAGATHLFLDAEGGCYESGSTENQVLRYDGAHFD